jgi:hypothetical protein
VDRLAVQPLHLAQQPALRERQLGERRRVAAQPAAAQLDVVAPLHPPLAPAAVVLALDAGERLAQLGAVVVGEARHLAAGLAAPLDQLRRESRELHPVRAEPQRLALAAVRRLHEERQRHRQRGAVEQIVAVDRAPDALGLGQRLELAVVAVAARDQEPWPRSSSTPSAKRRQSAVEFTVRPLAGSCQSRPNGGLQTTAGKRTPASRMSG